MESLQCERKMKRTLKNGYKNTGKSEHFLRVTQCIGHKVNINKFERALHLALHTEEKKTGGGGFIQSDYFSVCHRQIIQKPKPSHPAFFVLCLIESEHMLNHKEAERE